MKPTLSRVASALHIALCFLTMACAPGAIDGDSQIDGDESDLLQIGAWDVDGIEPFHAPGDCPHAGTQTAQANDLTLLLAAKPIRSPGTGPGTGTSTGTLCSNCHTSDLKAAGSLTAMKGSAACGACHDPNNSRAPWMTALAKPGGPAGPRLNNREKSCEGCHVDE